MARKINKSEPKKKSFHKIIQKQIHHLLQSRENAMSYKGICSKLEIKDTMGKQKVLLSLDKMLSKGILDKAEKGKYRIAKSNDYLVGVVDVTRRSTVYVTVEGIEQDIVISSRNTYNVISGDVVKLYVYKQRANGKLEGKIIEVVGRERTEFIGQLELSKEYAFVVPDNKNIPFDIFVPIKKINRAQHKDKVVIHITDWGQKAKNPSGKIIKILGKAGEHHTEIHSILEEYSLPYEFSAQVEEEANAICQKIDEKEVKKRRDMREVTTFTIDPMDAKDFDDALSVQRLENGNWEIGVHIADVSHYVKPHTKLDEEAFNRATSVYLVDRVIPMLPEVLSNKVCSLIPNEQRYTFSAIFEMDERAHILSQWLGRTVILSDKRFTYEQAQQVIDSGSGDLSQEILLLDKMAKILRNDRMKKGAVSFDRSEVKFNLDGDNNPVHVYFKEAKDSNHLIEEFMLLANKKVSEFIGLKGGKPSNKTFVYRVHDEPDSRKLASLNRIVRQFGYKHIQTDSQKTIANSINQLLNDVKGEDEANMLENLAMRCMSKAEYSTDNIGHYGLAFDYYSHFTSPIRRYPDVMVHRLLQHYLDGGKSADKKDYQNRCKHSSGREQLATNAERESIKYMQMKFMKDKVGQEFEGVITGVTRWGVYVEIVENLCEGMIKVREIQSDYYKYDEDNFCIVGKNTKNVYRLGDKVVVQVKNVDDQNRVLDFKLIEEVFLNECQRN